MQVRFPVVGPIMTGHVILIPMLMVIVMITNDQIALDIL